jgi:hypothetical protein
MADIEILSAKQQAAIMALLRQPTVTAAAHVAGCGERTLYRWLQEPAFQKVYREARRETMNQTLTQLQQLASEAVVTLAGVLRDPEASSNSKVSAAKLILDHAIKDSLEERLQELEEKLQALSFRKGGSEAWEKAAANILRKN